nr:hypothetical protein [Neorhizobium tomejilense]
MRAIEEKTPQNFTPVATIEYGQDQRETVMHDGKDFFRRVCPVAEIASAFPDFLKNQGYARSMYLKLMDDESRNGLEHSALTWPTKEKGRARRFEHFDTVMEFDELDGHDAIRCRNEAERLIEGIAAFEGAIWIRCAEPCYLISRTSSSSFRIRIDATFADQDLDPQVVESYMSATDREAVIEEARRLADNSQGWEGTPPRIHVVDDSWFDVDFADRAFLKFATFAVENIAAYLSEDGVYRDGTALLESDPTDIDLWNELRQCVKRMRDAGTSREGDDDLVMRGVDLWKRYGGATRRPHYHSAAVVDHWFEMPVRTWLDRPVNLWSGSVPTAKR